MMRAPDFETDGWCLDDGETRHAAAPATFEIPERDCRERLQPGDLAKLIFRIQVDDEHEPESVERMWVIVRERLGDVYLGILDNDPFAIAENDELWSGVELPFEARHVIAIKPRNASTIESASREPTRRWPK